MFKEEEEVKEPKEKKSHKQETEEKDKSKEFTKRLNDIKGKICLNIKGKSYYVSEFSIVEERVKKIEEKYFFNKVKEVDKIIPEFISEIITINGSSDKVLSFNFDEEGKSEKIDFYTLEDLIYNFENDREIYLSTKESLNKLGYVITK